MQWRDLRERFVKHCEKTPAAQNNETLQNTPLPAGKGSDFRLPQFPEYRKPDRQVIPLQTEVPQNRLHSQPPGGKPLLRKITHLAASETIVPFAVDAHRSESGAQRSAEYLHQAAFSTAIASQQCRCSAGFDGKIYTRKNHPITERQLDRIYFKNMFFRGVHTVQGIRISAAYNTPASLCRNSHPTAYVVEPPDCGNSRTHRYNAV